MRAVFFDASGVLFENGTARFIQALVDAGRGRKAEIEAIVMGDLAWQLRLGKIEPAEFYRSIDRAVRQTTGLSTHEFRARWTASFVPQPGMEDLLLSLHRRAHPLGIVAETTKDRVVALEARFPWTAIPRWKFWSFEERADKRNGELFFRAVRGIGKLEDKPFMIEDDPAAADHAARAGFEPILFSSAAKLQVLLA